MLPDPVVDDLPPGALVVEIGVGGRFNVLEALASARPDLRLVATDVNQAALDGAPEVVGTHVDDVWRPDEALYDGAALIFAVRCPAELQVPTARLAARVGARLALRAFKDEWADVDRVMGQHTLISTPQGAWRIWEAPG